MCGGDVCGEIKWKRITATATRQTRPHNSIQLQMIKSMGRCCLNNEKSHSTLRLACLANRISGHPRRKMLATRLVVLHVLLNVNSCLMTGLRACIYGVEVLVLVLETLLYGCL